MASEFDYEAETNDEAVRAVAADIRGAPLAPLSPEEITKREIERETQRELYRQQQEKWQLEREQQETARAAQEKAEWLAEHRRQEAIRQRERTAEIERLTTQRSLSALRLSAAKQDAFANKVEASHVQAARQQHTTSLMQELERSIAEAPLTKPVSGFAERYRNNQRSGLFYVPEDSDE